MTLPKPTAASFPLNTIRVLGAGPKLRLAADTLCGMGLPKLFSGASRWRTTSA